jgi:hypothetical protein
MDFRCKADFVRTFDRPYLPCLPKRYKASLDLVVV